MIVTPYKAVFVRELTWLSPGDALLASGGALIHDLGACVDADYRLAAVHQLMPNLLKVRLCFGLHIWNL